MVLVLAVGASCWRTTFISRHHVRGEVDVCELPCHVKVQVRPLECGVPAPSQYNGDDNIGEIGISTARIATMITLVKTLQWGDEK
jgi:hypothetical protein